MVRTYGELHVKVQKEVRKFSDQKYKEAKTTNSFPVNAVFEWIEGGEGHMLSLRVTNNRSFDAISKEPVRRYNNRTCKLLNIGALAAQA
jgi:hypothetical protein